MVPLPRERYILLPPFQVTGIDFAGLFETKILTLRNSKTTKANVGIFVYFSTKAIHLELGSDLSPSAFHAAFSSSIERRGLPQRVVTDRNFLRASRTLEREFNVFVETAVQDIAQKYIAYGFEWEFIPPYAPHMGGLWEAAAKLKRIIGVQRFTFEEF